MTENDYCLLYDIASKRIVELEQENNRLVVDLETLRLHNEEEIGMLQSENGDLEEQIEKMKCCGNCANDDKYDFYDDTWHDACGDCENLCNWKLKE